MKIKRYLGTLLLAVAAMTGFTACQDDFDAPRMDVPHATLTANTTIAELKAQYWNDANNYIDTVKLKSADEHVIISGRVISSDASGNIYKSLVIQDETAALAMSINANSLYNDYRIGQEIVIDVTDMYIGKYSTLQQLGFPDYSASYGWQATFMPLEFFKQHAQLNGLPEPSKIDTLTLTMAELSNDPATMQKYQSQLVRFNNVQFEEGGQVSFCTAHKENTNRTLKDDNGNTLIVRTSGYANFWSTKLPAEKGDVVGILSTYLQSGSIVWQLVLRSTSDLMNFGNPTLPKGTETNPYDVLDAVSFKAADRAVTGWFTGYIVGAPKAGVSEITSIDDIQWSADEEGGMFITDNMLVIGQTAEAKSLDDVMLVILPDDTPLKKYGNLFDNDSVYHRQIWLKGEVGGIDGITGILKNTGAKSEFRIEGVTVEDGGHTPGGDAVPEGSGTEASPYNAGQVVAKGTDANEADKWVSGYIVGWVNNASQNFADEKNSMFTVPATVATNVLIANTPDVKDYKQCVVVNLPNTNNIRANVNLVDHPDNLGKLLTVHGTVRKYFNIPGVRDLLAYKLGGEGGGDNPNPPSGDAVTSLDENFASGALPTGWTSKTVKGDKSWFYGNFGGVNFAACSAYKGTSTDGYDAWLITPAINISAATSKVLTFDNMVGYKDDGVLEAYVMTTNDPSTATLTKLNANIVQPNNTWSDWTSSGDLSLADYNGTIYIGFRYSANAGSSFTTYRITNVKLGEGGGGGGGEDPNPPVTGTNTADLGTLTAKSSYGTYTTTDGWVAANCAVQTGGTQENNNPEFSCLGGADVRAVCLNGKKTTPGSLTSPTLTGGIGKLTFNFGFMFGEGSLKPKFTVNIKQNGSVVKTQSMTCEDTEKFKVQTFTMDCNVTGSFVIEIVNDCAGGQAGNKERISIWNISWTN